MPRASGSGIKNIVTPQPVLTFSKVAGSPLRSQEKGTWCTSPTYSVIWDTISVRVSGRTRMKERAVYLFCWWSSALFIKLKIIYVFCTTKFSKLIFQFCVVTMYTIVFFSKAHCSYKKCPISKISSLAGSGAPNLLIRPNLIQRFGRTIRFGRIRFQYPWPNQDSTEPNLQLLKPNSSAEP